MRLRLSPILMQILVLSVVGCVLAGTTRAEAAVLTTVPGVLQTGREAARARTLEVELEAVMTVADVEHHNQLWVQDGTNALLVIHTNQFSPRAGSRVRVQGVIATGLPVPVMPAFIDAAQVTILGAGELPPILNLPVAHLFRPEYHGRWIEQEGVVRSVDRQAGHFHVVLNADDAPVQTLFHSLPGEPSPTEWLGRRVRMQGACMTSFDAEGRVYGFVMHVPGTNFVTEIPGRARAAARNTSPQTMIVADSMAEALETLGTLSNPPQSPANATNTLPILTNVQQVLRLGLEGARRKQHPVRLFAVVTYVLANNRSLFVDDGTGGIEVVYGYTDRLADKQPGMLLWIDGMAGAGTIQPWIVEARLKPVGKVPLPAPARPAAVELEDGRWHNHWIEIEGVVRDLTRSSGLELLVAVNGHHVEVIVPYSGQMRPPLELAGARISARGLCDVPVDFSGRPTQPRVFLNDTNGLSVLREGTSDNFNRPVSRPASYRAAGTNSDDRIKIAGQVLFQSADGRIFLHDGVGPVQASPMVTLVRRSSRSVGIDRPPSEALRPGDQIELLGAPAASPFAPRFRDAEYRRVGGGAAPIPDEVTPAEASSGRRDAALITMRARVVGREAGPAAGANRETLLLDADGTVFEAVSDSRDGVRLSAIPDNFIVQASGICSVGAQADGHRKSFRLLLRDADDVKMIGPAAPWESLRPGRILAVSAGLGVLALAWVSLLRRQVRRHTADLSGANEKLQGEIIRRRTVEEDLRASETRKAAVLETALDSIITINASGRILDFNPAAERTFGYARAEAMGGEMAEMIIAPGLRERHRAELRRAVETGTDSMTGKRIEVLALRRSGEEFPVELALARIKTDAGPIFTAHIQDISERKRAEAEMRRALAHEKELSELKSRFVAMVSHEFRTPLGIIMSSAEILDAYLDRLPPAERRANLRDITQSSKHMAAMMEEVLLLGRVEAGKMVCNPAPLDLAALCAKLADEITSATSARCRIEFKAASNLGEAMADESLLRHILTNLINNAVKYSPVAATVGFGVEQRGPLAIFSVRDDGIGIPEADQRQIFQAFHRGHNVGETPGTGLGLVIVKRCVQLHGGKITFQSSEGKGSTFTVALPLFGPPGSVVETPTSLLGPTSFPSPSKSSS